MIPSPTSGKSKAQSTATSPGSFSQTFDRALGFYNKKRWQEAIDVIDNFSKQKTAKPILLCLKGLSLCRMGRTDQGFACLEDVIAAKPSFASYDLTRVLVRGEGIERDINIWQSRLTHLIRFNQTAGFVLSFPKCGRTWLRYLLGKYIKGPDYDGNPMEVFNLSRKNPAFATVDVTHDDYPHLKPAEDLIADKSIYAEKKVILLVRDPRDVLVSNYFQFTKRGDNKLAKDDFSGSLSEFIRYRVGGLHGLVAFYNLWAMRRHVPAGFIVVTYEALHRAPEAALDRCATFLGWPQRSPEEIRRIVESGSFERMREMEESDALGSVRLRVADKSDPESYKVRKGNVGGYKEYMSPEDVSYVNRYLAENLDDFYHFYK